MALFAVAASPAVADVVAYTDEASFIAAIQPGYYLEDFNAYTDYDDVDSPLDLSGGTYGYSMTAPGALYSLPGAMSAD